MPPEGIVRTVTEVALGLGAILVAVGVLGLYRGAARRTLATVAGNVPRTDPGDVRATGPVRVRGTVVPAADAFDSPVTGEAETVLAAWIIHEEYDRGRQQGRTVRGVTSVPFYLTDDSGRLLVDTGERTRVFGDESGELLSPAGALPADVAAEGIEVSLDEFGERLRTAEGEAPPPRVRRFLETTNGLSVEPMTLTDPDEVAREYAEGVVSAGDEVSVLGLVRERRDAGPDRVALEPDADTPLRVSTTPFDELPDGSVTLTGAAVALVAGLGLVVAGLAVWFGVV